jgi:hypothetical protein
VQVVARGRLFPRTSIQANLRYEHFQDADLMSVPRHGDIRARNWQLVFPLVRNPKTYMMSSIEGHCCWIGKCGRECTTHINVHTVSHPKAEEQSSDNGNLHIAEQAGRKE